jgi:hypothetical protein
MATKTKVEERKAEHGEKMIELRIRFWTDEIASKKDHVLPKHAWAAGMVIMDRNESHGIVPKEPMPFNSLFELPAVIEKALIAHGVTLRASRKMSKYFEVDE